MTAAMKALSCSDEHQSAATLSPARVACWKDPQSTRPDALPCCAHIRFPTFNQASSQLQLQPPTINQHRVRRPMRA